MYPEPFAGCPSMFRSGSKYTPWPTKLTQRSKPGRGESSSPLMCHFPKNTVRYPASWRSFGKVTI